MKRKEVYCNNPRLRMLDIKRQILFIDKLFNSADAIMFGFPKSDHHLVYSHFNEWLAMSLPFIVDVVVNFSYATEKKDFHKCSKSNERRQNTTWFWWPNVMMSNTHPWGAPHAEGP